MRFSAVMVSQCTGMIAVESCPAASEALTSRMAPAMRKRSSALAPGSSSRA